MLVVYGIDCVLWSGPCAPHAVWKAKLSVLYRISISWYSAEDVPDELFFMNDRGADHGRVLSLIQRDEEKTVYEDRQKQINLIIEHESEVPK